MNRKLQQEANNPSLRNLHDKQTKAMIDKLDRELRVFVQVKKAVDEMWPDYLTTRAGRLY